MEFKSDHKINKYFFLGIIILLASFLIYSLIEFFTAFLTAVMIYVLTKPIIEHLIKKKNWTKRVTAIAIIFVSFIIILAPITIFGSMIFKKIAGFLENPDLILNTLKRFDQQINTRFGFSLLSNANMAKIQAMSTSVMTSVLNNSLNFFSTITMMYFFLYFMIINVNRMEAAIIFFLPFPRNKIEIFGRELVAQTFSNAVAVPLIAVIQGLLGYAAYSIIHLPEPGFWAVITGFASIIPIVGTALVWVPAAIYQLATSHAWQGIFLLGWGALILGLADNVVRFLLAKKMADTHPIVTVLGVIMGLKIFNLPGLIFGPLLISYFLILLKIYYWEYQTDAPVVKSKKNRPLRFNLPFLGKE
jgi:predicted PurR-regulated permease PerM